VSPPCTIFGHARFIFIYTVATLRPIMPAGPPGQYCVAGYNAAMRNVVTFSHAYVCNMPYGLRSECFPGLPKNHFSTFLRNPQICSQDNHHRHRSSVNFGGQDIFARRLCMKNLYKMSEFYMDCPKDILPIFTPRALRS